MREDCRAVYACGHEEIDTTPTNVGESSYCYTCRAPQVIVARMSNGPRQPLDELHAENERLRGMLAYVARCLKGSDFAVAPDREYAASLAEYIEKRIPATELTDEFVSEQIMDRLYDEVQAKLDKEDEMINTAQHPTIVCLCGSTRFSEAFHEANLRETLAGKIVLSIGCDFKSDTDLLLAGELTEQDKERLDELHLRKIDLADEVLVLNVGGYIGQSTDTEIRYAIEHSKWIRFLEPPMSHAETLAAIREETDEETPSLAALIDLGE